MWHATLRWQGIFFAFGLLHVLQWRYPIPLVVLSCLGNSPLACLWLAAFLLPGLPEFTALSLVAVWVGGQSPCAAQCLLNWHWSPWRLRGESPRERGKMMQETVLCSTETGEHTLWQPDCWLSLYLYDLILGLPASYVSAVHAMSGVGWTYQHIAFC